MLNPAVVRLLSTIMILILPLVTAAADVQAAMAYVQGTAKVNGNTLSNAAAVFPGDAIQTAAGSTVSLVWKGSSVLVAEGSAATYRENEVVLTSGSAQVRTTSGMSARVAAVVVAPVAAKPATFEVARLGTEVRVTAVSGAVSISDGKATTLLESGTSITLKADGTALPLPTAPKSSLAADTALIIMVFTAIAAGVAVGVVNALNDSPSVP